MTTENEISKVLECLAPWIEKTDGEESVDEDDGEAAGTLAHSGEPR